MVAEPLASPQDVAEFHKREWLERVERLKNRPKGEGVKKDEQSCWAYLPDLVLEEIFKMLPFEVGMA